MESARSLWITGIAASVAIIITVYGVWANIESQKGENFDFSKILAGHCQI
jgi:hypothetical protein